ncbi:MAG: hypothetical protein U9N34_09980, partial [Candidatus Cloacimonadota bacterium]|nr:hypothetical protein [Candidatus Cloacimonadota bacterium]
NRIIKSKGFQKETRNRKNKLTWVVTESGKRYCQILDTGKKYSNGTPIQQIKWVGEVLTIKA